MDILLYGLSIALIGMGIVFVGLLFLIYCISLIKKVGGIEFRKKKKQVQAPAPVEMAEPAPAEAVPEEPAEDDGVLIAVLSAAIAAVWDAEQGFVVRRVRRIHTSPAWEKAGREEQVYSRI